MKTYRRAWPWIGWLIGLVLLLVLLGTAAATATQAPPQALNPAAASQGPPAIAAAGPAVAYFDMTPLAIRAEAPDPVQLRFQITGGPSSVKLVLNDGSTLTLTDSGGGSYAATLTGAQALYGYRTSVPYSNYNHNHYGFLDLYQGTTRTARYNLFMNVVDEQVPAVAVQKRASDAQMSPHVANIQVPAMSPTGPDMAAATRRFYQIFPDNYDFINVIFVPQRFANRDHAPVRNQVQGIGLGIYSNSSTYGSGGRLLGITRFPLISYFDLAETAFSHELGHQWINFLDGPALLVNPGAHWPLSDLAESLMGVSGPASTGYEGLDFPYTLAPIGGGNYSVSYVGPYRTFSDMDLYLMGMLPASSVGPHFVFNNQNQTPTGGGTLLGPVTTVTVNDVIAANGPRVPAYPAAQHQFRVATLVMSKTRLLTPTEMAFLDYFAARGSLTIQVPYSSGLAAGVTKPFYLATGGRGSLITTLDYHWPRSAYLPAVTKRN